jgi:hypothetical protein
MKWVALLASGIVSGFVVCHVSTADAGWQRVLGISCKPAAPDFSPLHQWYLAQSGIVWVGNGEAPYAFATCPVQESSSFPKSSVTQVNVHGEDRSTVEGVRVQACVTYWSVSGGDCGTAYNSGDSFLGQFTGTPSLARWSAAETHDFPYFMARMPAETASGSTSLRGMYIVTP